MAIEWNKLVEVYEAKPHDRATVEERAEEAFRVLMLNELRSIAEGLTAIAHRLEPRRE